MSRSLFLPLLVLSLPACITVRGAAGPVMTPHGEAGLDTSVGFGVGKGAGTNRAFFLTSELGFALSPVEHEPGLRIKAGLDYVSEEGAAARDKGPAWRAGLRLTGRPVFVDEETTIGYVGVGASAALFPLSWAGKRSGHSSDDKIGDIFGTDDLRGFTNLGLELAVERLFSREAEDAWLLSLALVFDMSLLPD